MTVLLGYRHVGDFLAEQSSAELIGWLAYLRVDDEVQMQRMTIAVNRAFVGGKTQQQAKPDDEAEEVIDTTKPEFAEKFKGFTGVPLPPQRGIPQRQMSTEILLG